MEQPLFFVLPLFSLIVCLQNSSSFLLGKKNNSCLMSYVPQIARVGPVGYIVLWGLLIKWHTQNSSCRKCCTNVSWGQFSTVFLYAFNDSYNGKKKLSYNIHHLDIFCVKIFGQFDMKSNIEILFILQKKNVWMICIAFTLCKVGS